MVEPKKVDGRRRNMKVIADHPYSGEIIRNSTPRIFFGGAIAAKSDQPILPLKNTDLHSADRTGNEMYSYRKLYVWKAFKENRSLA